MAKQSLAQKKNFNGNGVSRTVKTVVKGKATKGADLKHKAHRKSMA